LQPVFRALDLAGAEHETLRHTVAFLVGFSCITFLHIVAGEQAPKSFGIRQPLSTALWVAYPLRAFHFVMYPFIWLLNEGSLGLLRGLGLQPAREFEGAASEEELRLQVASSQKHFGASAFSRDLVRNALDLHHRVAREVMRPRQEIVVLDTEAGIADCVELAERTRYSRFPLCEGGNLDRTMGVVHIKDLYAARQKAQRGADLLPVARKLVYVPESARLERVLQILLEKKLHAAIVVDEYGGTVGLLTLENILEELVGQIQDEFDTEKPLLVKTGEGTWEIDGALPLHELADLVGEPLTAEGVSTVSGWVTQRLGGFPRAGISFKVGKNELCVEAVDGLRVARVKLTKIAGDSAILRKS
jgi:CBS domain containing-hemolysin-like protein